MTDNSPTNDNDGIAAKMAKALEKAGIKSHQSEPKPMPRVLAFQAFLICDLGNKPESDDFIEWLTTPAAYYRKMAELCLRALRRPHMPEELVEHMTYAWGYFSGRLEAEVERVSKPDAAA